jgi:hypothetical protein
VSDTDDSNLIEVKAWKADGEPFLTLHRSNDEPFCGHKGKVLINENRRTATCALCGTVLDPIDVLWWLAMKERELIFSRDKKRALEVQIAELKAEERRVKARLRRARAKEADR